MVGSLGDRYSTVLSDNARLVVIVMLVATVVIGVGVVVGDSEDAGIGEFEVDHPATDALNEIDATYGADDTEVTQVVFRDTGNSVLDRASLIDGLAFQEAIQDEPVIAETIVGEGPIGMENLVAIAAYEDRYGTGTETPTLADQRSILDDLSDEAVSGLVTELLTGDRSVDGHDPARFVPTDSDPDQEVVDARLVVLEHVGDDAAMDRVQDAQLASEDLLTEYANDGFVFGQGIIDEASSNATGDSFTIIAPVALVFTLVALWIAYRDPVDMLIALGGIGAVLVWMAGIMGWLDIPMSQLLIAVPFLLIGLSIDYALHVVMRYREARDGRLGQAAPSSMGDTRAAMAVALGGVILALSAATVSTGIGFLSNYSSPLPAVQDFALLSGLGIFATFLVFGAFVPAVKIEVDEFRSRNGSVPERSAFGVGGGGTTRLLTGVVHGVTRAPVLVLVVALVIGIGGAAGATGIDTEFNEADFLPEDAPEWAKALPGPLATGTYTVADDSAYLSDRFAAGDDRSQAQILISEEPTDPEVLVAIDTLPPTDATVVTVGDGRVSALSPLTVIRTLEERNERVADAVNDRDTTGDRLPDSDIEGLYELLFEVDPELAGQVIQFDEDGVESVRIIVDVESDAGAQTVASGVDDLASHIDENSRATAVATGDRVVTAVVQDALLETLVMAFLITVGVIFAFLTVLYYWRHGAVGLGAITLAPVVIALAWLLGAMYAVDIPYNSETAVITGLAIGLGTDYSIHLTERITAELDRRDDVETALVASLTGTGGALLGSALTTAAGFAVLAFALVPPLQRFGIVTATAIAFAFLACLLVLPALFVLRDRLV